VFIPITKGNGENYTEIDTSDDLPKKRGIGGNDECVRRSNQDYGSVHTPGITRSYCDIIHLNERLKYNLEGFVHTDFDVILIEPVWLDCILIYYFLKMKMCVVPVNAGTLYRN